METKRLQLSRKPGAEGSWVLSEGETVIENYTAEASIDFALLMKKLMEEDLQNKYMLLCDIEEPLPHEKKLISILKKILEKHSEAVDKFQVFLSKDKDTPSLDTTAP